MNKQIENWLIETVLKWNIHGKFGERDIEIAQWHHDFNQWNPVPIKKKQFKQFVVGILKCEIKKMRTTQTQHFVICVYDAKKILIKLCISNLHDDIKKIESENLEIDMNIRPLLLKKKENKDILNIKYELLDTFDYEFSSSESESESSSSDD